MFLRNLYNCTSIPSEVKNSSIKQGDDRVHPTMNILTADLVMTDKTNHRLLVKEGKSAKSMSSMKLWSKSKTSNKSTSHGEGLVETEYSLRNNYCSVRASDKVWWVTALSQVQELEKDVRVHGSPRFCRVRFVTISTHGRLFCSCGYIHRAGKPCHHCYHVTGVIECTDCENIWWDSFHYHFGKNIEYTRTAARIINSKKLGIPYAPSIKKVTKPVYNTCVDYFIFKWIMQSPIPILVTDPLPVRKGGMSLSEESADSFEVHFDPNYSEYDLMANRQYKETKYSQELKLATSPVSNVFMPYRYHMESYKTLINYAQTHPKANEYLKEVMKDSIAKMVRFTTESGMVECAAGGDMKSNTSTIRHRSPHVMGVPLRIV
jgi:hypothetical protein